MCLDEGMEGESEESMFFFYWRWDDPERERKETRVQEVKGSTN